jgi:hypothetical protein
MERRRRELGIQRGNRDVLALRHRLDLTPALGHLIVE